MNATQQQRALEGLLTASGQLANAVQAYLGGNGGVPTVPSLYLNFLPPQLRDKPRDFFVYSPTDFATIAALGGTGEESFNVQNDSDFLIVAMAGEELDPADEGSVLPPAPLTIQVRDGGSGRNWFNRPQAYGNVVGTGQLPAFLPYPKFVDRASEVTFSIVNNDPTADYLVRLSCIGFKIFDMMR